MNESVQKHVQTPLHYRNGSSTCLWSVIPCWGQLGKWSRVKVVFGIMWATPNQSAPWYLIYQNDLIFFLESATLKEGFCIKVFLLLKPDPICCTLYFGLFFQGRKQTHVFKSRIVGADWLGERVPSVSKYAHILTKVCKQFSVVLHSRPWPSFDLERTCTVFFSICLFLD